MLFRYIVTSLDAQLTWTPPKAAFVLQGLCAKAIAVVNASQLTFERGTVQRVENVFGLASQHGRGRDRCPTGTKVPSRLPIAMESGPAQAWPPRTPETETVKTYIAREDPPVRRNQGSLTLSHASSGKLREAGAPGGQERTSINSSGTSTKSGGNGGNSPAPPVSVSTVPVQKVPRQRSPWKVMLSRISRLCGILVDHKIFVFVSTLITVWALMGDDLKLLCTNKPVDDIFDGLVVFCIVFFSLECLASCLGKDDYFGSFFFILDVISTGTLFMDLTTVSEALFSADDGDPSKARSSRTGTARVGAKVGRVVRVLRLIRIVKLFKAFLQTKAKPKPRTSRFNLGLEDDFEEEFVEEEPPMTASFCVQEFKIGIVQETSFDKESLVGKKLSAKMTQWTILLVPPAKKSLTFRQKLSSTRSAHESRGDAAGCTGKRAVVTTNPGAAPSCCAPRDANHRGPEMLLARGARGGELLGASEATCPGGAPCHEVRACTELQFGPVEDEVTLHDHWRSEDTKTREQSARTSVWGVVEGHGSRDEEEEDDNEERSGTVVGTRTTRTTRTLKTPDMLKGPRTDHKVHQESTKSTSLPAESLASTAKGSRVNWNQDEVEDTSPKTPKTPNSGHRSMTSRSSRSSFSNLSEKARRAAATRAAMAQLHIDLEDPDGQSEGRSAGGGSVLARAASAVSRMLRAGSSLPGPPERGGSAVVGFSCVQDLKQQCQQPLEHIATRCTASDPPNRRILGAMQGFLSPRFEIGSAGQCQQARSHARGQPMSEADCDYVLLTSRHHFPDAMVSSRSLGHDFLSLPPNACPQLQSCGGLLAAAGPSSDAQEVVAACAKKSLRQLQLSSPVYLYDVEDAISRPVDVAKNLSEQGCCFVSHAVPASCCQRLAAYVDDALAAAQRDVELLAYATRRDRIEFTLPLEEEVREVLEQMVASLGQILEPFVTRHGRLVDLSCMISDPDCEYQPLHSDTSLERVKFTCFVALQDVTVEMGPTYLCPGTQNDEHHSALDAMQKMQLPHDEMLERLGAVPVLCQTGDAYIMNSQLLHCGGAQASAVAGGKRRRLLYVTWHLPGITPGEHSLRDELVGRFRLGDFDNRGLWGPALPEDFDEKYSELFIAANKLDDAEAMLQFAKCLRERGDLGAVAWMRRACRRGHPLACMHLAEVFCLGELGMAQDLKKAEELRTYAMALCEKLKRRASAEEPELPLCLKCSFLDRETMRPPSSQIQAFIVLSDRSSMLGATSRTTQRMPTLTSISQRRTLASMVSFRLNSPQLLRATRAYKPLVNLGAVLRDRRSTRVGFGRSLIGQAMASAENVVRHTESFDDYMLSFQTRRSAQYLVPLFVGPLASGEIDQFWSHSWRANTFLKVMAPAAFFSILSGGVGMALRALHILPYFVKLESAVVGGTYLYAAWTSIFGLTAFLSVLFLWRPKQRVFLDKVCIHQKDPVLKKEGVESIGAFLYYSQTMLVLWDPSYATRLWCVFEMAAFAWAHRSVWNDLKNRVEIRPVIFAPVYFGLMVTSVINWALLTMFPRTPTMSITVWPALQSIICILGVHFLRSFHRDMTILRQHLAEFQAANAQCYCCSVSHRLPETGERIACDREVIQACIMTWFGTLTDFDSFVQAELAGYFWRSLGHFGLPYRWVLGSQLPVLWAYMDIVADSIQGGDVWYISSMVVEGLAMWLCASPLVVAFVIWVTNLLQRKRKLAVCDTLVSLWAASLALIPVGTLTFLWYVSRFAISPTNPLPGAIVFLIVTAEVTTLTYKWGRSNCFACRQIGRQVQAGKKKVLTLLIVLPLLRIDMAERLPTSSTYGAEEVLEAYRRAQTDATQRSSYDKAVLRTLYYHNWYTGRSAECPTAISSCSRFFLSHAFWVGIAGFGDAERPRLRETALEVALTPSEVLAFDASAATQKLG
eukprot:s3322_g7.t1